jgi:ribosomal RNA-processing protein 7
MVFNVFSNTPVDPDHVDDEEEGGQEPRLYGMEKWTTAYKLSKPSLASLNTRVEEYMVQFDSMQDEKREARNALRNQPDEDGFITVISKRKAALEDNAAGVKKKKTELDNFYRFQMKDTKRKRELVYLLIVLLELTDLRVQFEKDKKRVEALKNQRKFKPY